ncbi:sensor histidine kinase, partial [Gorillibacterium massiliense]|uniref:sensor histidine kinase n=1 Tax=Gorillibacterium massiliense TaxID=1280390 RepID=UPI000592E51A
SMTATAVSRTLDRDFDKASRQIRLIEEMASVAQSEMRALLLHLRPVHLEGKRLAQAMKELITELQAKVPMDIVLEMEEDIQLPKGIEDHLFRILQEALSNALRHSKAGAMEIRFLRLSDGIRMTIKDDGVGFQLGVDEKHASYGLASMKERINEIGGSIHIVTAPGKGTRIEIRVPLVMSNREEDENG